MLLVASLANKNDAKNLKNDWKPCIWLPIWENSANVFQWIPIWQDLGVFQESLCPRALDESSLSIGRVNIRSTGTVLELLPVLWNVVLSVNPSNGKATYVQKTIPKDFWKISKPCHVGIHCIALAEYSHMSTHMPGFRSFFNFLHSFLLAELATSSIWVKEWKVEMWETIYPGGALSIYNITSKKSKAFSASFVF